MCHLYRCSFLLPGNCSQSQAATRSPESAPCPRMRSGSIHTWSDTDICATKVCMNIVSEYVYDSTIASNKYLLLSRIYILLPWVLFTSYKSVDSQQERNKFKIDTTWRVPCNIVLSVKLTFWEKKHLNFQNCHLYKVWQVAKRWNYYDHIDFKALFRYIPWICNHVTLCNTFGETCYVD